MIDQNRIYPKQNVVREQNTAQFRCNTHFTKHFNPQWLFNDQDLLPNMIHNPIEVITIQQVRKINQGYYECIGFDDLLDPFFARGLLYVRGK